MLISGDSRVGAYLMGGLFDSSMSRIGAYSRVACIRKALNQGFVSFFAFFGRIQHDSISIARRDCQSTSCKGLLLEPHIELRDYLMVGR